MGVERKTTSSVVEIAENLIRIGAPVTLAISVFIMAIAIFDTDRSKEAYMGSFDVMDFNYGWYHDTPDGRDCITLPATVSAKLGEEYVIYNTLPQKMSDGMHIMTRSNMEDIKIYVDGNIRSNYSTETVSGTPYFIPSAYVVADLYEVDAGKEIQIKVTFKAKPVLNEVSLGHGNNVWFEIIRNGLPVNLVAVLSCVMGGSLFVAAMFLANSFKVKAARNMGLLMVDVSLWILSEATIRQFIFLRPSLSQYFSYYLVELISVFACLYFDEVQHRVYHKRYVFIESVALLQVFLNIILNAFGILDYYQTLPISQGLALICAFMAIFNIIKDIRTGRIQEYYITGIGMILFIAISLSELLGFYLNKFHVFGTEICFALIILMVATVIQTVYDEIRSYELREMNYTAMTIKTIETIASAIDAKDEYTGGHSERVGMYAQILAREMAADYDLSEEDILRIHYIGLVHDIGKIGVADDVLNKAGKLSDEEFSLMKKHAEIGYEIMSPIGTGINGLLDGIRHHHERFDGKGYPDGLSGIDIPLVARIMALADSYDAMTSNRVYRVHLSDEQVRAELIKCSGTQFDPALTEIFIRLLDKGAIKPMTIEGLATDKTGVVRNSSILEMRLQQDLDNKEAIVSPTHVRMLCYLMKLMEKKGKDYQVVFARGLEDETHRAVVREAINAHDVIIQYSDDLYLIALYDKTQEEMDEFMSVVDDGSEVVWEYLSA